ncbi:hypothetical protein B0I35DRAFT_439649 [Stachybotrys elegans]|uniref:Fringe-like glycosyltransferase domain-containing protein n=1 Tax=Stachybotrys elegans TaxID=80388 RepID=A0A8K0WNQ2_9HYPO|nr:hypothetical protein B0I35DRAFT_439649 [Stachybotrys elegans]
MKEQPFSMGIRNNLMSLAWRAPSIPTPVARVLRLMAVLLVFLFMLRWNLVPDRVNPSTAYAADYVVKTSDMRDSTAHQLFWSNQHGHGHGSEHEHEHEHELNTTHGASPATNHALDCKIDAQKLSDIKARYEMGDQIEYLKRYVQFTRTPIARHSYTRLDQKLLPGSAAQDGFRVLDLSTMESHDEKCEDPLQVSVPESKFPADADLSDFLFAISTTFDRLRDPTTIREWAYWLTDGHGRSNGGKLLLRLRDAAESELTDTARRLDELGIDAEVSGWGSAHNQEMAVSYVGQVPFMFSHASSSERKWFVLCDDDTFFTAASALAARFKEFDHTKPLYIGTLSEDMVAVRTHGSQAFGGGGVFLSRPLVKTIFSVYESCVTPEKVQESNSGWGAQGDILLRKCIYENTDIRLTHLPQLWQLDLAGDATGFYESGIKPFSVHHFKSGELWHTAYPLSTTKIAHTCGEDCPYMRFLTADGFVISNGFSVAQYPEGVNFDLDQVEATFHSLADPQGWNFDYTFGPQRLCLHRTGKKLAWELRESEILEDGSVSQVYIRKKDDARWTNRDGQPLKALDGVIELVWIAG